MVNVYVNLITWFDIRYTIELCVYRTELTPQIVRIVVVVRNSYTASSTRNVQILFEFKLLIRYLVKLAQCPLCLFTNRYTNLYLSYHLKNCTFDSIFERV